MAVDSKIETFAKNLFLYLYYESEALPKPKSYEDAKPEDSFRLFKILQAVTCRQEVFHWLYTGIFNQKYDTWKHSTMDFYVYLREELSDFSPYMKPNVFNKVLISCAFVLEMGLHGAYKNNSLYLDFPTCWAMFFDSELKEEFYSKGGWEGLENHSLKYQPAHQYISEILAKRCVNDCTFVENLTQKANTDYDLQYLLQLLEERTSKYKGDVRTCYECLPLFSMSPKAELLSEIQTISTVERVLQILLLLIPPPELEEFQSKAVSCFLLSYSKEQETFKLAKGDRVNPLSLSQPSQSLESAFHEIYADERKVDHIRGAVKKLATEEVFRRIFMDRNLPDECMEYDPSSCSCCLRKLESSKKKELYFHIETIKAVIDEVTFSERSNHGLANNENRDLCQKKNKTQTATASLNLSQDSDLVDEDLALKLFLALGIKTSVSYILPKTETVVKSTDESHQFKNGKNRATNQTAAKRTKIQKKKASGRSM